MNHASVLVINQELEIIGLVVIMSMGLYIKQRLKKECDKQLSYVIVFKDSFSYTLLEAVPAQV